MLRPAATATAVQKTAAEQSTPERALLSVGVIWALGRGRVAYQYTLYPNCYKCVAVSILELLRVVTAVSLLKPPHGARRPPPGPGTLFKLKISAGASTAGP